VYSIRYSRQLITKVALQPLPMPSSEESTTQRKVQANRTPGRTKAVKTTSEITH